MEYVEKANFIGGIINFRPMMNIRISSIGGFDEGNLGGMPVVGLIDTGATDLVISERISNMLTFATEGEVLVERVGSEKSAPYFYTDLCFDLKMRDGTDFFHKIERVRSHTEILPKSCDVLIPMTALQPFELIFRPNNTFELKSFG